MFKYNVVSQEVLVAGIKNKIGPVTEAFIKELRDAMMAKDMPTIQRIVITWMRDVHKLIGMRISFGVDTSQQWIGASITSSMSFTGHGGTQYWSDIMRTGKSHLDGLTLTVDREKGMVSGPIVDKCTCTVMVTGELLRRNNGFTDGEVTAIILHEFGHGFGYFETLGDYVYLNAYLAEGIEVLQGLKQIKSSTIVLNDEYLEKNVPKEVWEKFANDRNESNARRVLLHSVKLPSRGHITDSGIASRKRDEQGADLFVTRLGYGRELAIGLSKLDAMSPDSLSRGRSTWAAEAMKGMLFLVAAPLMVLLISGINPLDETAVSTRYDNSLERLLKIRRDLIQQTKLLKGTEVMKGLVADIEAIDEVTKAYGNDRGLLDELVLFLRPTIRKMDQNLKSEQKLEELLNNDLFFNIAKLKSM